MLSNELCKEVLQSWRRSFQEGWYEERSVCGCPSHLEDPDLWGTTGRNEPLSRERETKSQSPFFQPSGWAGGFEESPHRPGACPGNRMMNPGLSPQQGH